MAGARWTGVALALAATVAAGAACDAGDGSGPSTTSLSLSPGLLVIPPGDSALLSASVHGTGRREVAFSSRNESVAAVGSQPDGLSAWVVARDTGLTMVDGHLVGTSLVAGITVRVREPE